MRFNLHCPSTIVRFSAGYALFHLLVLQPSVLLSEEPKEKPAEPKALSASFVNSMELLNDEHKLGPGDQLSFRVIEDEDPSKSLTVTDSSEMDVPYLGRLNVAGKTCKTVGKEIKAALEKALYIKATVILGLDVIAPKSAAATSRGKAYLMGQVRQQGAVDIPTDEPFTVSKAVLRAGGFSDYANKRKVKLIHKAGKNGTPETKIVDLVEVLEKGRTDKDLPVEPEDWIIVPEKVINF
jgi:protein involved in polysaccharide export with SLBB domain